MYTQQGTGNLLQIHTQTYSVNAQILHIRNDTPVSVVN